MSIVKGIFRGVLILVILAALYVISVILYGQFTDYTPPPTTVLKIEGAPGHVHSRDTLSFLIWNLGYAGLGEESDFFMSGGDMVRPSEEISKKNFAGIRTIVQGLADQTDFFLLQEVDKDAARSYHVDHASELQLGVSGFHGYFGTNYQVGFVPVPFFEPYGKVHSGLWSMTRTTPTEATRYAFEGNYTWPTKLFHLDRCFLLTRYALDSINKDLVIINTHNSAYDDGTLKAAQMEQLKEVLLAEYEKGNYVLVGGDWNQYPPGFTGVGKFKIPEIDYLSQVFVPEEYPAAGWEWVWDPTVATNRSVSKPYDSFETSRFIIDYYLTSPNIEIIEVKGMDLDFEYSDHQPVRLSIRLKDIVTSIQGEGTEG